MVKTQTGYDVSEFRPDMYGSVLKESDFKIDGKPVKLLPPDFMHSQIRSGSTPDDLYRTIAAGVGGTAMPMWKGSLKEEDLWALVWYVRSLADLRDTSAADALYEKLAKQPEFVPAPPPPPPPTDSSPPKKG